VTDIFIVVAFIAGVIISRLVGQSHSNVDLIALKQTNDGLNQDIQYYKKLCTKLSEENRDLRLQQGLSK